MTGTALHFQRISAQSVQARACLDAYFTELAARFEGGLDRGLANSAKEEPGFWFIAATRGQAVLACAGLRLITPETAELKHMWVSPVARGQGVARALLAHMEAFAASLGFQHLRLDTNKVLVEAHALYRRAGYAEVSRFNDNPYAHLWFVKHLNPVAGSASPATG